MVVLSSKEVRGFCADRLPTDNGFTFTLTSLLSELLHEAEMRYGERDRSWTPVGIEFCGDKPLIWYPGNRRHVSIMLSESARLEPHRAIFQLAHEVIHLLSPTGREDPSIFEEGLAAHFAQEMSIKHNGFPFPDDTASYIRAETLVLQFFTYARDGVRQIRREEPSFVKFTPEIVSRICPALPKELAETLCQPFVR